MASRKSNRRKLVLFICEGPTDENALYMIMKSFFNPSEVKFHIVHGDFFLSAIDEDHDPERAIHDMVTAEIRKYGLRRSDILAVFHCSDTDGAFIPNENVIEDPDARKIQYEEDGIHTRFPESIICRNRKKRKNMNILSNMTSLGEDIPYRIYYFSHNIEHALYGRHQHMSDHQKTNLSDAFADRFEENWRDFYSYLLTDCGPLGTNYHESWVEIRKGNASVQRHTNLNLLFEEFGYTVFMD